MLLRTMTWLLMLLAPLSAAHAQKTTWYRCTDAKGVVSLQNGTACPAGSKQEKREVEAVQTLPPPAAADVPLHLPPSTTNSPAPATAPSADGKEPATTAQYPTPLPLPAANTPLPQRLPPPPLFECRTFNNDSYLDDDPLPKQRCVPLNTVGIDGSSQLGAGAACSMQTDQCQRVPNKAACDAWRKWLNTAQASWTFARAEFQQKTKAEYERLARIVAETSCNDAQ